MIGRDLELPCLAVALLCPPASTRINQKSELCLKVFLPKVSDSTRFFTRNPTRKQKITLFCSVSEKNTISIRMMPETEANLNRSDKFTCSVLIGKTVLFLGGWFRNNQISQLNPLGLMRIGTLPFVFYQGTCLVIAAKIFLGFEYLDTKSCWSR